VTGSETRKNQSDSASSKGSQSNTANCGKIDEINALRDQGSLPGAAGPNEAARKLNGDIDGASEMVREGGNSALGYAKEHPVEAASWFAPSTWFAKILGALKGGVVLFRIGRSEKKIVGMRGAEAGFSITIGGSSKVVPLWTSTKSQTPAENALRHFRDHGKDFGALNATEYARMAANFLHSPPQGVLTRVRSNGDIVRFDPVSDAFGVMDKNGAPRTFFRPDPAVHGYRTNMDYFNAQ
jgi:hypothetical protein